MTTVKPRARLELRNGKPFPNGEIAVEVEGPIAWAIETLAPETTKPATAATVRTSNPIQSNEQAGGKSDD